MEQKLNRPIRVVFLTSGGILGDIVLRGLLASMNFEVVGIVQSRRVFKKRVGFFHGACLFFMRCGPIYTVYIWGITTFSEWLGFLTGEGSTLARAKANRLPVFRTRDVNSMEGLSFIRALQPQLLIAAHFDQKLLPPLCDGSDFAAVNIHPSVLPHYKGLEPVLRSWFDPVFPPGVTLHRLSVEIDGGRVLAFDDGSGLTGSTVFSRNCELMCRAVSLLNLNAYLLLDLNSGYQQPANASYHSWPTAAEVWKFYDQGGLLMDYCDIASFFKKFHLLLKKMKLVA
jgi:methionyl-tRNA formyltransferase